MSFLASSQARTSLFSHSLPRLPAASSSSYHGLCSSPTQSLQRGVKLPCSFLVGNSLHPAKLSASCFKRDHVATLGFELSSQKPSERTSRSRGSVGLSCGSPVGAALSELQRCVTVKARLWDSCRGVLSHRYSEGQYESVVQESRRETSDGNIKMPASKAM